MSAGVLTLSLNETIFGCSSRQLVHMTCPHVSASSSPMTLRQAPGVREPKGNWTDRKVMLEIVIVRLHVGHALELHCNRDF